MKKDTISHKALKEREQIIDFFNKTNWEPAESNILFDLGEEVDFEAEFTLEQNDKLLSIQYNAEERSLILSIDENLNSTSFLFESKLKLSKLLSIVEEYQGNFNFQNNELFIETILSQGIRAFRLRCGKFVEIFSKSEKENIIARIKKLLEKEGWVQIKKVPKSSKKVPQTWDIGACYYNQVFGIFFDISIDQMLICNRLYLEEENIFSDLHIYSSQFEKIIVKIDDWKKKLNKENYSSFTKDIIMIADQVFFDNNGSLIKLNIK